MEKEKLTLICGELKELENNLLLARRTRDGRSRDKRVQNALLAIADYVSRLPGEVRAHLDTIVGANALSFQHAGGDIRQCIEEIERLLKEC